VEPEITDVDISKEPVLVAIGRGIGREDNIELAEELADALGGVLCASRPVVDQGWLSTSRMVGKSGKSVKPSIYLAMGISGAPEHVEGMSDSELIIAVNTDPAAPIFDVAQYGAEIDLLDLLPVLTEKIEAAKGG
jgi:electron transfer flavoprotein alpha subunit